MKLFISLLIVFNSVCCIDYDRESIKMGNETRQKIKNWAVDVGKKYNLIVLCKENTGSLIDEADFQAAWCSKFMVKGHQMTIDEMRPIAESIYQSLWKTVKEDESFHKFLFYIHKLVYWYRKDLTLDHIGIRIDLWDENNDRYIYPHLSQVIVTGNKAYYYYADPKTQALQKPGVIEILPNWVIGNNVSSASNI